MARQALSAARTTAIINLLATSPDRGFTMAEIVRETGINTASCHTVLTTLMKQGFLTKLPNQPRFVLGAALISAGQSALRSHPLVERAQHATKALSEKLGVPAMLATIAGDDVLALTSVPDSSGRTVGMNAGDRWRITEPYWTLVFLAWSSDAAIDRWIAETGVKDPARIREWRDALALIRKRGFQLAVFEKEQSPLNELVAQMAPGPNKAKPMKLIGPPGQRWAQPEQIEADAHYDVATIIAPIFDPQETAPLALFIGGFANTLTGAEIEALADQLVRTCLRVMRDHDSFLLARAG